jgi:enamine deaminase RidA (YjgF/YER057c/UK114 family)
VEGNLVGIGNPYVQTLQILKNIERAIGAAGGTMNDVVRTRIYVTDIDRWPDVARAHGQVFGDIRPATAMVQVARLIDPAMLVEIEAEAILDHEPAEPHVVDLSGR